MARRVITISREFGSGGRTIGRLTAEKLGIAFYDEKLVNIVAKESGFSVEYVESRGEQAPTTSSLLYNLATADFIGQSAGISNVSPMDQLFRVQSDIIRDIAQREDCVIVGRCADFLLQNRKDCLNVFIHAAPESRAKRIVELYGEKDDKPEKRLHKKDQARILYYEHYTDRTWGAMQNYHLALDSSVLGIEACVEIVAKAASY